MKAGLLGILVLCAVVFAATSFVTFKVNQQRFNRRNAAGVEEFSSYGTSVLMRSAEWFVMTLARPTKWAALAIGCVVLFMWSR